MGRGGLKPVLSQQGRVGNEKEMRLLRLAWPGVQPVDGADFGWHHRKVVASIQELSVIRTRAFPTASLCGPPSLPHGIGAPTLIFHLILGILTLGSGAEGLCFPSPPRIKAARTPPPPTALATRVPARYSHHSLFAFKGLLCEREYVATSVCRLQHAEVLLTAALHQKDQNRGREGRGGGSPPSLTNLNFMRKQKQIMERRDKGEEEDASRHAACRQIPAWDDEFPLPAAIVPRLLVHTRDWHQKIHLPGPSPSIPSSRLPHPLAHLS